MGDVTLAAASAAEGAARRSYGKLVAILSARTGDRTRALEAYERAIGPERDPTVRRFLQRRAAACAAR